MKLAMLTSLSERLDRVLEVSHFELALAYLSELEKDLYKIFGGVGRNELADVALKIFNHVSLLPEPVSGKVLYLRFWKELPGRQSRDKEFTECINFLVGDARLTMYVMGIGTAMDSIIATPEVMQTFIRNNPGVNSIKDPQPLAGPSAVISSAPVQQQPEAQTSLPQVEPVLTDPLAEPKPAETSSSADLEATQASAPPEPVAAIVPPPMLVK